MISSTIVQRLFPSSDSLSKFCRKQDITYLGVFGSHARGEAKKNSDVDVLVDYQGRKSLFALGGLVADLEDLIGKKVDLVKRDRIKPQLKSQIFKDTVTLYEEK